MADDEGHAQGRAAAAVEDAAVRVVELMDRRRFLLTSLLGALAAPFAAGAQHTGKVYRIGFLGLFAPELGARTVAAVREGLGELGWREGQNIVSSFDTRQGSAISLNSWPWN